MPRQVTAGTPVAKKAKASDPAKKTVVVTADDGVTFAGEHHAKGKSIQCTAEQEAILIKHKAING